MRCGNVVTSRLIEVAAQTIAGEIHPGRWANLDDAGQLTLIRRFCEVATSIADARRRAVR